MIYLNNAATSFPKPECVINAVSKSLWDPPVTLRSSSSSAPKGDDALADCRKLIASFLGIRSSDRVVITPGCTYAANQALMGMDWQSGDRIIISGLEHHAISRPVRRLSQEKNITFDVSPYRLGQPFDLEWFEKKLVNNQVKLVACSMVSNVTGEILPFKEIVSLAHFHGALCMLDAAQAAGVVEIDVEKIGCDLLIVPGHKGLMGPTGIGALYVGRNVDLSVMVEGGTGKDSGKHEMSQSVPSSFETGTHNVCAAVGLTAGILKE